MNVKHVLVASAAFCAISVPATADVLVVDADGGAPFTAIQPAIDAAVDGDTIYVKRALLYTSFVVDNKALTIVGHDNPQWPDVTGSIQIKNLAAGKTLTLSSFRFIGTSGPSNPACLKITSCSGVVRIARSVFLGQGANVRGALVEASPNVAFAGCTFFGENSSACATNLPMGPAALEVASSNVALYECGLFGGRGSVETGVSAIGGPGLLAGTGSLAFSSRSLFQGGTGGPANTRGLCPVSVAGDGGPGIQLNGPVFVQLLDDQLIGGFPAPPGIGADHGPQYAATGGASPFFYSVSSLGLRLPSIAEEGDHFQIEFSGDPGDQVYLNDGLETSETFDLVASWRGVVVAPFPPPSPATRARRWGVIPASGLLKQIYRAPTLPAGVEAQTRFLQVYRIGASGLTLGSFTTLTVLDSSF
jgi:hypothetical protein